jgi:hypothetical protein
VYLALLPSDAVLYAALAGPVDKIAAFTVNGNTGGLAPLTGSPFPGGFSSAYGLTMDPARPRTLCFGWLQRCTLGIQH